jgi:hypothetical protein
MEPDPISYPKLTIDGQEVEVKFRIGDLIRLKKDAGVDLLDSSASNQKKGTDLLEYSMMLLSHGIAHSMKKTAEELYDCFDLSQLPDISNAIRESLEKASARAKVLVQPVTTEKPN